MLSKNRILHHFNRHLALAFGVIAVSTFNYGFDNAAYNNAQAMTAFQTQFGDWDAETGTYKISPSWLSLFNSLNYIGFGAGVIIGSLVSERWGRRWCMFGMSAWALVPAIMAVTAVSKHQIMATRILNCKFCLKGVPHFHVVADKEDQISTLAWSLPSSPSTSPRSCRERFVALLLAHTSSA